MQSLIYTYRHRATVTALPSAIQPLIPPAAQIYTQERCDRARRARDRAIAYQHLHSILVLYEAFMGTKYPELSNALAIAQTTDWNISTVELSGFVHEGKSTLAVNIADAFKAVNISAVLISEGDALWRAPNPNGECVIATKRMAKHIGALWAINAVSIATKAQISPGTTALFVYDRAPQDADIFGVLYGARALYAQTGEDRFCAIFDPQVRYIVYISTPRWPFTGEQRDYERSIYESEETFRTMAAKFYKIRNTIVYLPKYNDNNN